MSTRLRAVRQIKALRLWMEAISRCSITRRRLPEPRRPGRVGHRQTSYGGLRTIARRSPGRVRQCLLLRRSRLSQPRRRQDRCAYLRTCPCPQASRATCRSRNNHTRRTLRISRVGITGPEDKKTHHSQQHLPRGMSTSLLRRHLGLHAHQYRRLSLWRA